MKTAQEVMTTVGYPNFVRSLLNRSGDPSKDFTHCVLGIITEIHEYSNATDQVNAIEEAGDLIFYAEGLRQVLNDYAPIDVNGVLPLMEEVMERLTVAELDDVAVEWLDLAKRWVGYGKAPTMSTTQLVAEAQGLVAVVIARGGAAGTVVDSGRAQIEIVNVEKLLKRYNGMVFNADRAVNRDLPAERAVLEASAG